MALPRAKLGVSLFRHPCRKPLPRGERLCMPKGSASCRAFGHTRPASVPGYITGATAPRPSRDACSQPHKATARCSGTNGRRPVRGIRPCDPNFLIIKKFFDSLQRAPDFNRCPFSVIKDHCNTASACRFFIDFQLTNPYMSFARNITKQVTTER